MRNSQGKRLLTSCSGRCQRGSYCAPQNPVVTCHAGRLEDKSANVRKVALQLLATLLLNNPFGPHLPAHKFTVTLEEHKQKLKVGSSDTTLDAHWLFTPAASARTCPLRSSLSTRRSASRSSRWETQVEGSASACDSYSW